MATSGKPFVAIVLLLRRPRELDLACVQHAADSAYRGAPVRPKAIQVGDKQAFGVGLGPLRLGVVYLDQPYFKDIATAANRVNDVAARMAIQQHVAWLSVDLVGEPPMPADQAFGILGCLAGEFLGDDVLGLIRLPTGQAVGYDFSLIPLFRNRRAAEAFSRGTPDRLVRAPGASDALAAATGEAMRRWPEFLAAFASRQRGQGFGVKKKFSVGDQVEHMWVNVLRIDGALFHGTLANTPGVIKSLKLHDPVSLSQDEVEDWIYTNGKENVGGFQAKVLRR